MTDYAAELIETAYPYWECEAELAKRFFEKATDEDHVFYLKAQLWKELNPVDGFFNGLHKELQETVDMYPQVDKGVDRHDFYFRMLQLLQEFNHYVLLADIFEHVMGRPISPDDTIQLAEEKKLRQVRVKYMDTGSPIDRAAVGLTEGGGARIFREGAKLKGSKVNEMTAKAMQTIFDDEKDHYEEQAKEAVALIKNDDDLQRIKNGIREISMQRVKMRQEMFRESMSDTDIESFIAASNPAAVRS